VQVMTRARYRAPGSNPGSECTYFPSVEIQKRGQVQFLTTRCRKGDDGIVRWNPQPAWLLVAAVDKSSIVDHRAAVIVGSPCSGVGEGGDSNG